MNSFFALKTRPTASHAVVPGAHVSFQHSDPVDGETLAAEVTPEVCESENFVQVFAGNRLSAGMDSYATCYGGHQFGHWAGQLGEQARSYAKFAPYPRLMFDAWCCCHSCGV